MKSKVGGSNPPPQPKLLRFLNPTSTPKVSVARSRERLSWLCGRQPPLNEQQVAAEVQQDVNIVVNGVAGEPSGLAEMCVETEFK